MGGVDAVVAAGAAPVDVPVNAPLVDIPPIDASPTDVLAAVAADAAVAAAAALPGSLHSAQVRTTSNTVSLMRLQ